MSKIAFVFAGQGAQAVGMGQDLYERFDSVKKLYDLSPETRDLCFNGTKEDLDITVNTQPAVFLTDLACAAALSEKGVIASGVAGFSLGEIAAACYAGMMDDLQALRFVLHRAKAMHECAQESKGTMLAVLKLSDESVQNICKSIPEAYPVNYNAPGQVVVACAESTVEMLQNAVTENGGKAIKLAVSGAFHSPFMDKASASVATYLENESLGAMKIPLYSNVTAQRYDTLDAHSMASPERLLTKQVNHPVLWQETIENMINDGFRVFIEAGPGKTLTGLIKKINPDVRIYNVSDVPSLEKTIEELDNA